MTGSVELTVLMPCLNEAETLARCIRKAQEWGRISGVAIEVLIADNGSSDGSQEIARGLCARVLNVPERGYGAALYHGSVAAAGRYVVMGDSDDSYDFSKLDLYITRLRDGYDLVMGNRFLGGIAPGAMPWKNRHIGNPVLSGIGRIFFWLPSKRFPLRHARLFPHSLHGDGPAHNRHGVRLRDGNQGDIVPDAHR